MTFTAVSGCTGYFGSSVSQDWSGGAVLSWDSEVFDTDSWHDGAGAHPERFTVPSGVNYVECLVQFSMSTSDTGWKAISFYLNGVHSDLYGKTLITGGTGQGVFQGVSPLIQVSAGDYLHATLTLQNSGSKTIGATSFMSVKGFS